MKIIVYGVTNWDSFEEAESKKDHLIEWYERIKKFIPSVEEIFLTSGSFSNPDYNPLPCNLYQVKFDKNLQYSRRYNYFRYGFMVGIWHTLLNNYDFDLLIHCQTRNLIGEDLTKNINNFLNKRDEILMAPSFNSLIGSSIDVSLMFMKKKAAISYTQTGVRQNFEFFSQKCLNCEEEAFLMFRNNWYNPWKNILSIKQFDSAFISTIKKQVTTPFTNNLENFITLPFISALEPHTSEEYKNKWKILHPYQ